MASKESDVAHKLEGFVKTINIKEIDKNFMAFMGWLFWIEI